MPLRRTSPSSLLLNPPLLIILLPTLALLVFFLIFPSFLSISSHKIRPNSVRKSWDSLNIFLVLFAILCGVFARRNDDDLTPRNATSEEQAVSHSVSDKAEVEAERVSVPSQPSWFDQFSHQKIYGSPFRASPPPAGRLKRSSSSYPDLRQESWGNADDRFRFFDDFEISKYGSSSEFQHHRQQSRFEESNCKEIPVDTFVLRSSQLSPSSPPRPPEAPSPAPTPPPPPPPPPRTSHKERRVYKTVPRKEKVERASEDYSEFTQIKTPPPTPPPPPPPPPRPPPQLVKAARSEQNYRKAERKKTTATKEIKMVLASLYNQRKRKKKQKTKILYDDSIHFPHEPTSFTRPPPSPPPPPPPPPSPPSMFYSLFRKGSKSKKVHSFSAPPPPPPPPPPPSLSTSRKSSKRRQQAPPPPPAAPTPPLEPSKRKYSSSIGRPPLPARNNTFYEENVNSGGQSPLIPMPPPPPPPPFRVHGFRFVVSGDFVKIRSASSSRCSSPEREEVEEKPKEAGGASVFCPSPDVNVKADTFIARLRDEWRLEKINSLKEKRNTGPGPSPSTQLNRQ